jgi:hypothetical protein
MADTSHLLPPAEPVEGDGISYAGIAWFLVVLTLTTLFCQALVWGMFEMMKRYDRFDDGQRAPLAAPAEAPSIERGRLESGTLEPPPPNLLLSEPTVLREFRAAEDQTLSTYGWIDKNAGIVRLPIDRAKALVLERGLPVRAAGAPAPAPAAAAATKKPGAKGK